MKNLFKVPTLTSKLLALRPLFLFATKYKPSRPIFQRLAGVRYCFATTPLQPYKNVEKGEFKGDGFFVQQLLTGCLSIYSYYIESGNEAFLIDPMN